MLTRRLIGIVTAAVSTAALTVGLGAMPASAEPARDSTAAAEADGGRHYYILIGGTCDPDATVYNEAWLRGGIAKVVRYPAGGAPGCMQTPMNESIEIGHAEARRVVQEAFAEDPGASFTVVGYSQGAIVANLVLNDLADDTLGVDKSRFSAKLYADPMQPVGPPGRGASAVIPAGAGVPDWLGGWTSFGPGRTDFNGIPFIRYCIQTDGVCHFDTLEAAGGYFA